MKLLFPIVTVGIVAVACKTTQTSQNSFLYEDKITDDFDPTTAVKIGDMFESIVKQRHPAGTTGVKRAVFLKPHGCAQAKFTIPDQIPESHRIGLFATPGTHDAWVRISSDTVPQTKDQENNTIGFAVKVLNVPGQKVLPGEEAFTTHDFVTQNHHVFFVDTAKDFLEFTKAALGGTFDDYVKLHPTTDQILKDMAKEVPNILASTFWSTTPYQFGKNNFAKYKIVSCTQVTPEEIPAGGDKNYLRTRLIRDLAAKDACFELQVQLAAGPDMPTDRATVNWNEKISPPITVAKISIPKQKIEPLDQMCENMSMTPWHALPEHRPVGSVNKARGLIYKRLADYRRTRNSIDIAEPK